MSRGGWEEVDNLGTEDEPLDSAAVAEDAIGEAVVLGRFASGEFGREGGAWLGVLVVGGGVVAPVITGLFPSSRA